MPNGVYFVNQNRVFDKLFKDLDEYTEDVIKNLDAEMGAGVEQMATKAKQLAPTSPGGGRLRASINVYKEMPLSYNLRADAGYAAYVEFGTGPFAKEYVPTLDAEWQEYAKDFQKPNPGHTPQQPFFYRAVREIFPLMIRRMEDIIK